MCLSKVLIWSSFYHKWNISHLNELISTFEFLCFCKHQKSAHLYLYDNKTLNKRSFMQRKILYEGRSLCSNHWIIPSDGWHRCWWRMLETKCVGDKFKMLVANKNHQHNKKSRQHNDSVTNISNRSPS